MFTERQTLSLCSRTQGTTFFSSATGMPRQEHTARRLGGRTGPTAGETGPPVAAGRAGQPAGNMGTIAFPDRTMHLKKQGRTAN